MDTVQLTDGSDIKSVNLHSVVLLSVLDHHIRRKEDQHRVIGTLLGYTKGGVVYVRNCFPVPHTETEQVAVDMNYHRNMFELHQKANSDEEIVGWYASGSDLNEHSVLIHNFYGHEMEQPPVHLCIGTDLASGKMGVNVFVSEPFGINSETPIGSQFRPLDVKYADETEYTGLSSLLATKKADFNSTTPLTETSNLRSAFDALLQRLDAVSRYVDDVVAGKVQPDPKIGRYLADTMARVRVTDMEEYQRVYNASNQDHLMTIYVSNLTRMQLFLSKKLENLPV
mmetsp:Transcript_32184/g.44128  ORF Transcript_32184/g.44128 Transcript_32184/m.44128 type:complete len:283 (-) Transcript_32184:148-996(-)|eukprot:CAMPEP_0201493000 /NCGR_PEP_ID=MMETSP0151_2-20130828/35684_1 /ASSEMBLY_ACC=CAM_ASM_000257 /TAXON_ID=200890 /ORGANISM="Paramoeba atlantica, Strain 621/1 / CCAP 1560/9" /LENGTH=282 /DNA_ID=CAMNT_0047880117 /DNA_START=81 /DNA_END=929 /DNA_ORIENTATION=-